MEANYGTIEAQNQKAKPPNVRFEGRDIDSIPHFLRVRQIGSCSPIGNKEMVISPLDDTLETVI